MRSWNLDHFAGWAYKLIRLAGGIPLGIPILTLREEKAELGARRKDLPDFSTAGSSLFGWSFKSSA